MSVKDLIGEPLSWLQGEGEAMVALVKDWSLINSGTYNADGLDAMRSDIRKTFSALDAEISEIATEPVEDIDTNGQIVLRHFGPVLRVKSRVQAKRRILLTGHLDTVFPLSHSFQEWQMLDDNILNGPGVADMKGGLIVLLWALKALERSDLKNNLGYEVLISPDEEIGSPASAAILADRAPHADFGMTYEPSLADGTLAGARKGSGNFALIVRGRAAHAGRDFYEGRNAVLAMSRFVENLYALNGQIGNATFNPAVIDGGTAPNIVPDLAILRFNVRVANKSEQDQAEKAVAELAAHVATEDGISATLSGGFNRPPKELSDANTRLFESLRNCGQELGIAVQWKPSGGVCEGNNLAAAGLPNIDTLGVRGGKIHSADEFVCLDSFAERAQLSLALMAQHASGQIDLGTDSEKGTAA